MVYYNHSPLHLGIAGFLTCMMFGWLSALLMAASMMAIFSRFSWPLMADGSTIVFTATMLPFHSALYTCRVPQG
jgi:hypothetical protein